MATIKGINFLVKANTGTDILPVWTTVGGQKGGTLSRSAETMETTNKDSEGYKEFEAGFKEWSIETDGMLVVDDVGYKALEKAYVDGKKVMVQIVTAAKVGYSGMALVTDAGLEMPYDDLATYSLTLQGSGELKAEAGE